MIKCPYCAEKIQDEATVCKYCKRDIGRNQKLEDLVRLKKEQKIYGYCWLIAIAIFLLLDIVYESSREPHWIQLIGLFGPIGYGTIRYSKALGYSIFVGILLTTLSVWGPIILWIASSSKLKKLRIESIEQDQIQQQ